MSKKPDLAAAMNKLDTRADARPSPSPVSAVAEVPQPPRAPASQPGREGKKQVLGWFSSECKKQLKLMGADQEKTEQALIAEALNDLFRKYGKPTIA